MKKVAFLLLPMFALAACGSEPAPAPEPVETAPAEPEPTLPAPDTALFSEVFASTCEGAEPVSTSICRRPMGADEATCDFGIGEDEALRHELTLAANADKTGWEIVDADKICADHGAHHVDN